MDFDGRRFAVVEMDGQRIAQVRVDPIVEARRAERLTRLMSAAGSCAGRGACGRILWRVVTTLPVLWVVVTVVFLLIHLVPGDPIVQMLGEGATAADIAGLRHAYGLDVPLGTQYVRYWQRVAAWGSGAVVAAA